MRAITFNGKPLTLVGGQLSLGRSVPGFKAITTSMEEFAFFDCKGKIRMLHSFPSLDTPVCDLQVKEFNKEASGISDEVVIIGISRDLPFAQKRFCDAFAIKNSIVVSDYKYGLFGLQYGLLIKELGLLARAALIVDKKNRLRYIQIAEELTESLRYDEILSELKRIAAEAADDSEGPEQTHCKPCETGAGRLTPTQLDAKLAHYESWECIDTKKIQKEFRFDDFSEAKYFVDLVAAHSEEQGHHPTITIRYNKVRITLTTHAAGGLSNNDFIMAGIIDALLA